ncbi:hypothetical protein GGR53DRAFT_467914 [Hypoxylon sp. FL1150]|nr:hypothetical protein GGR53DRAFT_467914 [Hypoxylon sp. FL1150]
MGLPITTQTTKSGPQAEISSPQDDAPKPAEIAAPAPAPAEDETAGRAIVAKSRPIRKDHAMQTRKKWPWLALLGSLPKLVGLLFAAAMIAHRANVLAATNDFEDTAKVLWVINSLLCIIGVGSMALYTDLLGKRYGI